MKVSKKLTVSFLLVIALTVLVGVAGIVGMMQINMGGRAMFENKSRPLADLGMAREYFQRLRVQLRDVVLASGDIAALDLIETDLTNHERGFVVNMEAYRPTITDPALIELYYKIMEAFDEYQPSMQQIIASARVNAPPVQMLLMMEGLAEPTDFIMDALYYSAYIMVMEAAFVNEMNNFLYSMLFAVIIAVVAIAIIIALFLTKYIGGLISKPLKEIGTFADKVSTGEISMSSVTENSINVTVADEIGELARVLENSYIQLHEYERSKAELQRLTAENAAYANLTRMKNSFMTTMSHEIITPLYVIGGNAELIGWQYDAGTMNEETKEKLKTISHESKRLSQLVHRLLDVSVAKGDVAGNICVPGEDITHMGLAVCEPLLEKNKNRLVLKVEKDCPAVMANSDMVLQVLITLTGNASNNIQDGIIELKVSKHSALNSKFQKQVLFTVEDKGKPTPQSMHGSIFERVTTGESNLGFGLAVCKEAVEIHGGTIGIESPIADNGNGTRISFVLPVYEENKIEAGRSADTELLAHATRGENI